MLQGSIVGNIVRDVEERTFDRKSFLTFSVATSNFGEDTTFVDVAYFGKSDKIKQYLQKGTKVFISGPLALKTYSKKNGQQGTSLKLKATTLNLLGSKPQETKRTNNVF